MVALPSTVRMHVFLVSSSLISESNLLCAFYFKIGGKLFVLLCPIPGIFFFHFLLADIVMPTFVFGLAKSDSELRVAHSFPVCFQARLRNNQNAIFSL